MPQICKQALERPICMLLGKESESHTVHSSTLWWYTWRKLKWEWLWAYIVHNHQCLLYNASTIEMVWSGEMIPLWVKTEYAPVCKLSVFAPAHFWPSLKHLFSRCCSWQALHDTNLEILTENQTASRPLAATIRRLFFALLVCSLCSFPEPATHSDMEQITLS